MSLLSRNSGSFNLLGAFRACTGIALSLPLPLLLTLTLPLPLTLTLHLPLTLTLHLTLPLTLLLPLLLPLTLPLTLHLTLTLPLPFPLPLTLPLPLPLPFEHLITTKTISDKKPPRCCNEKFTDTKGRGKTEDNKIELHIKSDITIHLKYETRHIGKMITDRDNSIQVPSEAFFKRQEDIHSYLTATQK